MSSHQLFVVFSLVLFKFLEFFFILSSSFDLPAEVILSAILFPVKFPVAYSVFCTTLLEAIFAASIPVFVAVSINLLPYLPSQFLKNDKISNDY